MSLLLVALLVTLPPQEPQQMQRAILELVVNDVAGVEVRVYLDGDAIWIPVDDLVRAGLSGFAGERREFDLIEHVEMTSLAPEITAEIDLQTVSLRVTADPRFFTGTNIEMVDPRPPDLELLRNTTALLNYSAMWSTDAGTTFTGEANFSFAGNSAASSFSIDADGRFRRGISNITFDQPSSLRRWVLGDTFGRGGLLGSVPFVGGIRVGREYSLDPYYVNYATPVFAASVTTPSTAEVYVDGQPAQTFTLPPGPFQLSRLPVETGLGSVRVVVRDAFGREQVFDTGYYLSTQVLRTGEQDYEYLAGFERTDGGDGDITYGDVAASARHRFGVSDWLTLGLRAEGAERVINGGPTINLLLPRAGELELQAAASEAAGLRGYSAAAAYQFTSHYFSFSSFARWQDDRYSDLFLEPTDARNRLQIDALATVPIFSRGSLSAGYARNDNLLVTAADGTPLLHPIGPTATGGERVVKRSYIGRFSYRLFSFVQASATATFNRAEELEFWEGYFGLSFLFGRRTAANVSYEYRDEQARVVADVNGSPPLGPGIGYRIQAREDPGAAGTAELRYQNKFNQIDLRYDVREDQQGTGTVNVSGALVGIGGRLVASRPVNATGFALVRLPEIAGVEVFANHQSMGRTRGSGTMFIPDLLAYHANTLSYRDTDVPLDYVIGETSREIAMPFRGGAVVDFPLRLLRAYSGNVTIERDGQSIVPEYGDLAVSVDGAERRSPLNANGMFYVQDIPPGSYTARVEHRGTSCTFQLEIPEADQRLTRLGEIACDAG